VPEEEFLEESSPEEEPGEPAQEGEGPEEGTEEEEPPEELPEEEEIIPEEEGAETGGESAAEGGGEEGGEAAEEAADEPEGEPAEEPAGEDGEPAGEPALPENEPQAAAGLLAYLESLTSFLPEEQQHSYEEDEMRLRIEALRARLEGRSGLLKHAEQLHSAGASETTAPQKGSAREKADKGNGTRFDSERISGVFSYLESLSIYYPNREIGTSLRNRLHSLSERMRGGRDG
jgi:hypothetical protein